MYRFHRGPACTAGTAGSPAAPAARARARLTFIRDDRGANPIELAILLPVIVFALLASIQVSLYYLARSEALGAAQQGVTAQRAYLAHTGTGTATANQFVAHGNGWLTGVTATATCPTPGSTSTTTPCTATSTGVTITVTGSALSLVPGWNLTVSQSAHGTVERITHPAAP